MKLYRFILGAILYYLTIYIDFILSEYSKDYVENILTKSRRHIEDNLSNIKSNQSPGSPLPNTKCYFKRNHPAIAELSKRSSIFAHAVDTLMTERNCSRHQAEREINKRASARPEFNANILCNARAFNCPTGTFNSPYRNPDGSCNNPNQRNSNFGVAIVRMERLTPAKYGDGTNSPRISVTGAALPNPRAVSLAIHPNVNINHPTITHMVPGFGQFLDHDITSTPERNDLQCCNNPNQVDCFPITVANNDPFYSQFGIRCLEFGRSVKACGSGMREQINQVTGLIDGSQLYGSSQNEQNALRTFSMGQLASQGNGARLPVDNAARNCGNAQTPCFKAGDSRVNENPELFSLTTLFMREHNRVARGLSSVNPSWNDQTLFQEARRIVIAEMQNIVYNEYLPVLLGSQTMQQFRIALPNGNTNYDSSINPNIINSFATACYRLHTLVQDNIALAGGGTVQLQFNFQNPALGYTQGMIERLVGGMTQQPAQRFDNWVVEGLTDHLFQRPNVRFGSDLISLNIQRGRDHGLPGYPVFRQVCGLSAVTSFNDLNRIFQNTQIVPQFQNLYRNVQDIDLWSGGVSEIPVNGGVVGPTFACVIATQFNRLLYGDRYFFTHGGQAGSFTANQLSNLRNRRLANILCENGVSTSVQPNVFLQASGSNPVQGCPGSTLNLSLWRR